MTKDEYWHLDPDDQGMAGPFDTIEDAQKDAEDILHSRVYGVTDIRIVKTVSKSFTQTKHTTTWSNG